MDLMLRLILIGRPGSGKGVQGRRLLEELRKMGYNVTSIITSKLLAEEAKKDTVEARIIKKCMREGILVPDEIVEGLIAKEIMRANGKFILDGFPRTIEQAKWLDEFLKEKSWSISAAIYFEVDELTSLRRLMGRLECSNEGCRRIYNIFFNPPPDIRRCSCGALLRQREDDRYGKIVKRLDEFNEKTLKIVEFYEKKGILMRVDASKSIEEITNKVLEYLLSIPRSA